MAEIGVIIAIVVGLFNILTHLLNMKDRAAQEGMRTERVNKLLASMEDMSSRVRALETMVGLLNQKVQIQDDELKGLRADLREAREA